MNKPYSFSIDQLNGIAEDTYAKIMNECENLKKNTNCLNEQVLALLSYRIKLRNDNRKKWSRI